MTIRRARTSDLADLVRLCAAHAEFEKNTEYRASNQMPALEELIFGFTPSLHCLVFDSNGSVIGYTTFMKQVATWSAQFYLYVDCIYIETAFRRRGLGKLVFQRLAREARRLDCDQLQWQTPVNNSLAIGFYKRLGGLGLEKVRFSWEPSGIKTPEPSRSTHQRPRFLPNEESTMSSAVSRTTAASSEQAVTHFANRQKYETDCWDVHHAMTNDRMDFVLLDVRAEEYFAKGHVPGSISLPHWHITEESLASYPPETLFVVYCAGPHCNGASKGALKLAKLNRPVKEMIGGALGWTDEGFELKSSSRLEEIVR